MASGRWRAQVWDVETRRNISVSLILGGSGSYPTKAAAQRAREEARKELKANPTRDFARPMPTPAQLWGVPAKGEPACRHCGDPARVLHHIVPKVRSRFGRHDYERNGLPLCKPCHHGWHHRLVEIAHDILTDAEFAFVCEHTGFAWVDHNYPGSIPAETRHKSLPLAAARLAPHTVRSTSPRRICGGKEPWVGPVY